MNERYGAFCLSQKQAVTYLAGGCAGGMIVGWLYYGCVWGLFAGPAFAVLACRAGAHKYELRQRRLLREELRDYVISVIGFLRSGYALENAMSHAEREMLNMHGENAMMTAEARLMRQRLSLQITPEQLWQEFAGRTGLAEGRELARIFGIAKRQGGDYLPVLEALVRSMDAQETVRGEIETVLAGGRLEYRVMCLVPLGILLYLNLAAPDMTRGLYSPKGHYFMSAALVFHTAVVLWGEYILEKSYDKK